MDESILTCSFQFSKPLSEKDISEITYQMSDLEGVTKVNASEQEVTIAFNGYVQTEEVLKGKLEDAGYLIIDDRNNSDGWFQKFLRFIARGNKEAFKGRPPDCCNPDIRIKNEKQES